MATFLVLYGTGEGQTEKVATRIGDVLIDRGHEVTTVDANEVSPEFAIDDFDAVLVGASIHAGKHQPSVREFVTATRDSLATKPTAFFQVSLSSADEGGKAQAAGYVEEFIEATDWNPDRIGLFGGALRYTEYGFLKRLVMKQIAKRNVTEMPDADSAGDIEFTDWDEVEAFAADVAAFVEGRLGITPPAADDQAGVE
ncbi:flavodoxin domain-containing protein [Natronolimnohabitans innermongolicus]|uniref:Flavodoxin/nitric oxide synthase n=1 Tax=Natronolimnohabitans innermongolicus JCM 12255 TaxID=1227499 RepID=L9X5V2_9EURY|nr:flavodoxin domain-containing protein [Natronolimnohabitans innermongolicus]ELY57055.1 flavodoxin/nitric oxide synthase [Natronolimnohabitans innermongolicus JCM 12255]